MNLEKYQRKNKRISSVRKISICKSGRVGFSALLEKEAELKPGDKIDFYKDKDNNVDWYFSKVSEGDFLLRKSTSGIFITCKDLTENLMIDFGVDFNNSKHHYYLVGVSSEISGRSVWPILLSKNI